MNSEPDYENSNLEELEDVLEHIDREAYPERTKKVQEERNKRLAKKSESNTKLSINPKLIGVTGVVYSPTQAALGAFLGGPFASLYFLKTNFEVLKSEKSKKNTIALGSIIIFSLLLILPFLPDNFPNIVIPLLTVTITKALVEKFQFTKEDIEISEGLKYQSNWGILWTSIICLVLLLIAVTVFILIIEIIGVSVTA
ncbi:hypothetical protein CXF83_05275 [Shewanella sp. Choline-02u-19]|uniref:hypothetical protein n=1 Tax=unclassified Shewanella TaxID=196818 RepID=UPI000C32EB36|nr:MULTISPECIES: hypothetical protein [unclassified Shewanella]PKH56259.1 hypothetical protein CXF84_13945 [Shewanella sp. Bg11-22]PKI30053.1 hypothetical protein CXF83_05275 [Shewanella sp. Choline-02u-19]